eukprot:COSAG02_NODE_1124_length_14441_cov_21.457607_15_plen_57_part_00
MSVSVRRIIESCTGTVPSQNSHSTVLHTKFPLSCTFERIVILVAPEGDFPCYTGLL